MWVGDSILCHSILFYERVLYSNILLCLRCFNITRPATTVNHFHLTILHRPIPYHPIYTSIVSHIYEGISKWPYAAIATALEVIPRTLAQNCGANVIRLLTELRTKHSQGVEGSAWGVDGTTGVAADMNKLGIWEPYCVKTQTLKTAIESACLILRIDDVVSGTRKKQA